MSPSDATKERSKRRIPVESTGAFVESQAWPWTTAGALLALWFILGRADISRFSAAVGLGEPAIVGSPRFLVGATVVAVLLLASKGRIRVEGWRGPLAFVLGALGLVAGASIWWGPSGELAVAKAQDVALVLCVTLSVLTVAGPLSRARSLWAAFVVSGGVMALCLLFLGLIQAATTDLGRIAALGGGPNVFGRNMLLVLCGASLMLGRSRIIGPIGFATLGALTLVGVVLSGSRGALLAFVVMGLVLALHQIRTFRGLTALTAVTAVIGLGAMLIEHPVLDRAAATWESRVVRATLAEQHLAGRDRLYGEAVAVWRENPVLGLGLGSFQTRSALRYPHNIVLETGAELGTVGAGLLLLLLLAGFWCSARAFEDHPELMALWAGLLIHAMWSGDIYDSRGVFLLSAMAVTLTTGGQARATPPRTASPLACRRRSQRSWVKTELPTPFDGIRSGLRRKWFPEGGLWLIAFRSRLGPRC